MSRYHFNPSPARPAARGRAWRWLVVLAAVLVPVQASAVESALVRSLLIPGLGQAHQGHYTRAAIYAGATVLSGFGLLVAQVSYNESVDKYDAARATYASYEETLAQGGVVSIVDMQNTYVDMRMQYDDAEDRLLWRNVFVTTLVATYVINIVDVLISKPYQPENGQALRLEVGPESLRVTKTFRF